MMLLGVEGLLLQETRCCKGRVYPRWPIRICRSTRKVRGWDSLRRLIWNHSGLWKFLDCKIEFEALNSKIDNSHTGSLEVHICLPL
jgi:hypothetical protein